MHRPEIFDTAKREVLAGNSVAILGMDSLLGIGTTTLAAAVARDEEVAKLHDGGVFWLNCRDGADDRSQLEELTVRLTFATLPADAMYVHTFIFRVYVERRLWSELNAHVARHQCRT